MWHEVRKQEKRIRCMIVDYKRRAERRKDYYDKIKADPTQFLQIHGRPCKIHLDPSVAMAGDSPAIMMSWQGSSDVVIDRFDVRAHLDYMQDYNGDEDESLSYEDRHINYERYRILVQNDFLGVSEEKFLHQLNLEEQFGVLTRVPEVPIEGKKKVPGAAIGFNYDDPTAPVSEAAVGTDQATGEDEDVEEDEDSDIDFDVCVDVNKVTTDQAHELNSSALPYGMESNDFFSFLTKDREEADNLRIAKELEEEKAMYSGRKSRRERRAYREKKLAGRIISPPSYASRKSPTYCDYTREGTRSRSRSDSPVNAGKITYITSYGGEEQPTSQMPPSPKLKHTSKSKRHSRSRSRSPNSASRRRRSRSRSLRSSHRRSPKRMSRPRQTYSRSRSPVRSKKTPEAASSELQTLAPPPPSTKYYGRRGQSSSSELSISEDETESNNKDNSNNSVKKVVPTVGNPSPRNKPCIPSASAGPSSVSLSGSTKMTPQERLKRKMQALINKQYKADKKAEREKREKMEQERIDREDEMRELSIKLRKRERMRRHEHLAEYDRRRSDNSGSSSRSRSRSSSRSKSRSYSPQLKDREKEAKRRSRSISKPRERIPPVDPARKWDRPRHSSVDRIDLVPSRRVFDRERSADRDHQPDTRKHLSRERRNSRDRAIELEDVRNYRELSLDDHWRFTDRSHECRDQRDPGHDWRGDTSSRDVPRALHRGSSDFGSPRETYRGPPARESRSPPRGYRIDTSPPRGYRIGASPPTRGYGHDSSHEGPSRKEYRPDFPPSRDYHRQASRDSNNRWDHRQNNVREWKSRSRDDKDHRDDSTNHREGYQRENSRPEYSRSLVDY